MDEVRLELCFEALLSRWSARVGKRFGRWSWGCITACL